MNIILQSKLNP